MLQCLNQEVELRGSEEPLAANQRRKKLQIPPRKKPPKKPGLRGGEESGRGRGGRVRTRSTTSLRTASRLPASFSAMASRLSFPCPVGGSAVPLAGTKIFSAPQMEWSPRGWGGDGWTGVEE